MMRRVMLFLLATVSMFAEVEPLASAKSGGGGVNKSKWFFGLGLGAGSETIEESISKGGKDYQRQTTGISTTFRGKIGGYHYFSPKTHLGLRYYYSLDYNSSSRAVSVVNERYYRAYYSAFINLLNLDMLIRLAEIKENKFELILGVAGGVRISMGSRTNIDYESYHWIGNAKKSPNLEAEINAGLRWMYQQKYGLELIARIPLNDIETAPKPAPAGNQFFDKLRQHYSVTLDFVIEL